MKKLHREGVDIRVAFVSAKTRLLAEMPPADDDAISHTADDNTAAEQPAIAAVQVSTSTETRIKSLLRPLAKFSYRVLKPVIRPIAQRSRRYLIDTLRHDILQEIAGSTASSVQEAQATRESFVLQAMATRESLDALKKNLIDTHILSVQELRHLSAETLQVLQTSGNALKKEMRNVHELSLQELQSVSATLIKEIQTSRKMLQQDILNARDLAMQ